MRRLLILIVATLLIILSLAACGTTPDDTTPSNGTIPNEGNSTPASNYYRITGETTTDQGFKITGKKYTYKNRDCLIVDVENQTDKNYTVSLRVHYLDAEGNEIKSQRQVFTGWAAGYQKYFFFQPNTNFSGCTYTLELEESTDECYAENYIAVSSINIKEFMGKDRNRVEYRAIGVYLDSENLSSEALTVNGYYIILDKHGEIRLITTPFAHLKNPGKDTALYPLHSVPLSEELVWPDELTGDVNAIAVITSVKPS